MSDEGATIVRTDGGICVPSGHSLQCQVVADRVSEPSIVSARWTVSAIRSLGWPRS